MDVKMAMKDILYGPHTDLDILGSLANRKIIIMINGHFYNLGTATLDTFSGVSYNLAPVQKIQKAFTAANFHNTDKDMH